MDIYLLPPVPEVFDSLKTFISDEDLYSNLIVEIESPWNKGLPAEEQPRFGTIYPRLSKERKLIQSENSKGRIWLTNGKDSVQVKKNSIWEYLNAGFYIGRTIIRKKKTSIFAKSSCIICKRQIQSNNLSNHYKFTHL